MEDQRKAFEAWFMVMFPRESLVRYDIDEISGLSPYREMPAFLCMARMAVRDRAREENNVQ